MKMLKKILKGISIGLIIVLSAVVLALTIRGISGNPDVEYIQKNLIKEMSPLESSSSAARYALVMSIVNNHSFYLTRELAAISTPDLAESNGHYVSLFVPGVSLVSLPFYVLGKSLGNEQLITFAATMIFAFVNFLLISVIVKKISKNLFAGLAGGLIFLFGTIAWPYATTLTQHHVTVFLILSSVLMLIYKPGIISLFLVGLMYSLSILMDYPNAVLMLPILILAIFKNFEITDVNSKLVFTIRTKIIMLGVGLIIGLIPSLWYNQQAHGNYKQLTGTLARIESLEKKVVVNTGARGDKTVSGFFKLSKVPQGMNVLLSSEDRGILLFSPIILLGLLGIAATRRLNPGVGSALAISALLNLILYSSWGDPWGGWGFGPRYLIPAMAILAVFLGVAIVRYGKNWLFSLFFFPLAVFSIIINLTSTLTTSRIPPSTEEAFLSWPRPIVFYGLNLVQQNKTGAFFYNQFLSNLMSVQNFAVILFVTVFCLVYICYILTIRKVLERT